MSLFDPPKSENRVLLALRLGWTIAEVYGRLEQGNLLWRSSSSQPSRLFLSDLNPTSGERFWVALQRLIYLIHQLFPPSTNSSTFSFSLIDITKYPKIDTLFKRTEQRIATDKGKLISAADLYDELNQWSRQIWANLDAEDSILADAVTLGARLADTFWQLHFPAQGQSFSKQQTWQHLLKQQRMIATIRLVRRVETNLPDYVGSVLRYTLWEWGIANELTRQKSGQLNIANAILYRFRSVPWIRSLRHKRIKAQSSSRLQLNLQEQQDLQKQLKNQIVIWDRLIFNRSPAYLLSPTDWQQVRWFSLFIYAFTVVLITTGGALLMAGLTLVVKQFLNYLLPLLPLLAKPNQFKDQLTLISTLVSVLAFLLTQFRQYLDRLRYLYNSIYNWVAMRKLEQRSLCYWNGKTNSLFWVWLQRLLRSED